MRAIRDHSGFHLRCDSRSSRDSAIRAIPATRCNRDRVLAALTNQCQLKRMASRRSRSALHSTGEVVAGIVGTARAKSFDAPGDP